jgi:hypothetical protein
MTVAELITYLQTQPRDLLVAYKLYSEQVLLEMTDITIETHCAPREDGWIQDKRPGKPTQMYLMLPGN